LRYSWARIDELVPGCGMKCRDMLTEEKFFLFERNMSKFPLLLDGVITGGFVPVGNCFMHTGFGVPIPRETLTEGTIDDMLDEVLDELKIPRKHPIVLSKGQTASFAAVTIRSLLHTGVAGMLKLSFQ